MPKLYGNGGVYPLGLQRLYVVPDQIRSFISMHKCGHSLVATFVAMLAVVILAASTAPAFAEADGPDLWRIRGVRADDTLNMHKEPTARSRTIARIPHDARQIRNLGCSGGPNFQQWQRMNTSERERAARARWCKVSFGGKTGWVAGRFLAEDAEAASAAGPKRIGAWTLKCQPAPCALEQVGIGTAQRTVLRIEPAETVNARIVVDRPGLPRNGTFTVYMDGDTITMGPIRDVRSRTGSRLVFEPGDITLGLLRQMARHQNMVISFPGAERGVEIHLEDFARAWDEVKARSSR